MTLLWSSLLLVGATSALAQGNGAPPAVTTTDGATGTTSAGASRMTAESPLKLAKYYTADTFFSEFDFFTANDPTNGYVNYVSKSDAQSLGLAAKQGDGSFIMRADAENRSTGRGRSSIRITSQDHFGDGVYILDMNHMPTGCGTWPAFWTVVKDGWPKGGEIDIIEGANAYPALYSSSYNATSSVGTGFSTPQAGYPPTQDVASLHTAGQCSLTADAYMTGSVGSTTCSAYDNGNTGCGAYLGGKSTYGTTSFGSGVSGAGGGWFAMWRDIKNSGGVYVYYWPRNASNVPDDVRYPNTSTTDVANWGQPGANLTVPSCKNQFDNHVIVFNLAFCGDYAGATYTQSGCPLTCSSFVQNNPAAFGDAYWSINSLRVYTANGKPAAGSGSSLSGGAIAGIVVGVVAGLVIAGLLFWRYKKTRRARKGAVYTSGAFVDEPTQAPPRKKSTWAGFDDVDVSGQGGSRDAFAAVDTQPYIMKHKTKSSLKQNKVNGDDSPAGSRRGSKVLHDGVYIATKKPRTGKTVLRPGMTARSYLDGETPVGGSTDNSRNASVEGFVMAPRQSANQPSWVG